MNKDCLIHLVSTVEPSAEQNLTNDIGEPVEFESKRLVYGLKKAVRQTEFFQAAARGFKPEICVEVNSFEYQNEDICELEGQRFRIYRAYPLSNSERTELYLTQLVGESDVFT